MKSYQADISADVTLDFLADLGGPATTGTIRNQGGEEFGITLTLNGASSGPGTVLPDGTFTLPCNLDALTIHVVGDGASYQVVVSR